MPNLCNGYCNRRGKARRFLNTTLGTLMRTAPARNNQVIRTGLSLL